MTELAEALGEFLRGTSPTLTATAPEPAGTTAALARELFTGLVTDVPEPLVPPAKPKPSGPLVPRSHVDG